MSENITSNAGRTVRLFLADGLPQGIVVADVGNWNGKALSAPRGRLSDLLRRPEASRTGVYILLGPDPDQIDGVLAYIGEADDIAARMRIHLRSESKDFFDRVVFLVSSDEMLTKGHVRYLESRLIKLTQEAGTVALTNDTHPDFQRLPEADRADMDTFVDNATLVLPVLGADLFRRRQRPQAATQADPGLAAGVASPLFTFATAGASATGQETDDGFVVVAGSTARRAASSTFPAGYAALRDKLVAGGQLGQGLTPEVWVFASDVTFGSPSAAASRLPPQLSPLSVSYPERSHGAGQRDRYWRSCSRIGPLAATRDSSEAQDQVWV